MCSFVVLLTIAIDRVKASPEACVSSYHFFPDESFFFFLTRDSSYHCNINTYVVDAHTTCFLCQQITWNRKREREKRKEWRKIHDLCGKYLQCTRSNKQRDTCVPIGISVFRKIEFGKEEREMNINTCPHVKMEKKKIIYLCLKINTTTRESYERFQGMVIHGRIQPKSQWG